MNANGANGMSDIEGKAARVAASECGQRASFNRRESGISNQPLHIANLRFETNSCELASISGLFSCHDPENGVK